MARTLNTNLELLAEETARRGAALESARSFAASAAHELRTPLQSALTSLDIARSGRIDEAEMTSTIDTARRQLERMAASLAAVRALTDAELADPTWFETLDLAELVDAVVADETRRDRTALVTVDAGADVTIDGWADGLRLAVANIVRNALVHGRPADGSPARVRVEVSERGVVVDDNGPGVPDASRRGSSNGSSAASRTNRDPASGWRWPHRSRAPTAAPSRSGRALTEARECRCCSAGPIDTRPITTAGCHRRTDLPHSSVDACQLSRPRSTHPVARRLHRRALLDLPIGRSFRFSATLRSQETSMTKLTGAQALIKSLEMEGVDVMFGLPGGCILPAYDPLLESSIRHILVRHEQGAGHMAEGYAHVTGRPGVAMVTSGPAATNLVTPLMDAFMDSIPMVGITGQVPTAAIGTDAFQECDTVGITRSVTKHNELVMSADDLPMAIRQAFHIATTGRPGPTLVDVPKDVLQNEMEWYWPSDDEVVASLPGYRPTVKGHARMIKEAAKLILASERPVLYVGGGVLKARAAEALRELAELTDIYVVTTLMARGAFPDDHPLCLGMPGMHGNATAVTAMQKADLLIALGARFDDRITGRVSAFAPEAKIIHVDVDPAEQGKVRRPDVPIVGDCKYVIEEIVKAISDLQQGGVDAGRHVGVEEPGVGVARAVPADLRPERAR